MGIPSFFGWLIRKFPNILHYCKENEIKDLKERIKHLHEPNLNKIEFDNFYIDMNGLIHPCFHPSDRQQPENVEEVFLLLTRYIDYLVDIVRPRKLLYLAVDGVAPRAKMNQQRSRRFKKGKETETQNEMIKLQNEINEINQNKNQNENEKQNDQNENNQNEKENNQNDNENKMKEIMDSNCITPGTQFMQNLREVLKVYVKKRMDESEYWNNLIVIISDAGVPGEGEHKIIDFIRRQKDCKNYNPNIRHCIYGLDADLIMLGLATHEQYFSIVRNSFNLKGDICHICKGKHNADKCAQAKDVKILDPLTQTFMFIRCDILRQYFYEMFDGFDIERCIDDFIFFSFLIGNDFLPHIPSLNINEGGMDILLNSYLKYLQTKNKYLTENGSIILQNTQEFLRILGQEEFYFLNRKRKRIEDTYQRMINKINLEFDDIIFNKYENYKREVEQTKRKTIAIKTKAQIEEEKKQEEMEKQKKIAIEQYNILRNKQIGELDEIYKDDNYIQYGRLGYKQRYYERKLKFDISTSQNELKKVVEKYFEGMNWVLQYYYQGCKSWDWYYPYYYAPFLEDLGDMIDIHFTIEYTQGKPFRPIEQLMTVLPPTSKDLLPSAFHHLMIDEDSPLKEIYPTHFEVDRNGERKEYKAVLLLPFIDENLLLKHVEPIEQELSGKRREHNRRYGVTFIFFGKSNKLFREDLEKMKEKKENGIWDDMKEDIEEVIVNDDIIQPKMYKKMHVICDYKHHEFGGMLTPIKGMKLNEDGKGTFMLGYINPQFKENHIFKSKFIGEIKRFEKSEGHHYVKYEDIQLKKIKSFDN